MNADDFGLSSAINAGIIRSHTNGIVASTSIVASGEAFAEAVQQARMHPSLGVGVHLTLVEETAVTPPAKIPTLAPGGLLPQSYGELMKGIASSRIKLLDVEREMRSQIEKCINVGLDPTHLDSHQHTHALPLLFPLTIRLANEYAIRGIRIPRGWPRFGDLSANRFVPKCLLCVFAHADALLFQRGGCVVTRRFAGLFESGDLTEPKLLRILGSLGDGATELVCHPGCDEPSPRYASWNLRRQVELASLTSASVKNATRKLGAEIINYRQL